MTWELQVGLKLGFGHIDNRGKKHILEAEDGGRK